MTLAAATATATDTGGGTSNQGPQLHGTGRQFERVHLPLGALKLEQGRLVVASPDEPPKALQLQAAGYTFEASERVHQNVYGMTSPDAPPYEYVVRWRKGGSSPWYPLCPGAALVVQGQWDDDGTWWPDRPVFSFACLPRQLKGVYLEGGAIAKCIDWGYPPWVKDAADPAAAEGATRRHLACTRMAMADYCGANRPNTIEGTPIHFTRTAPSPGDGPFSQGNEKFWFEAAWAAQPVYDGCPNPERHLRGKVLCLTKKRWQTFPLNGPCAAELPDPRMQQPTERPVFFCEERLGVLDNQAMVFSYSRFLDVGLYRFELPDGSFLTTSHVEVDHLKVTSSVAGAMAQSSSPDGAVFEGTVFSTQDVPWDRLSLSGLPHELVELHLCKRPDGSYLTTTQSCPDDPAPLVEGYVLSKDPPITSAPLFEGPDTGGHDVTTSDPSVLSHGVPPLGYLPELRP